MEYPKTKVAIVGDSHDDDSFIASLHKNLSEDVQTIVQLGDFGFGFNKNMIASIAAWLRRNESHRWYWVDGNHDQHDYLDSLVSLAGRHIPIDMSRLPYQFEFPERLMYCPRGSIFKINRTYCMAMGGAFSIDINSRKEHVTWWPQEMITYSDIIYAEQALEYRDVDVQVMFTHDAPMSDYLEKQLQESEYKTDLRSAQNRKLLSTIIDFVKPDYVFHGHFHHRYTTTYKTQDGYEVRVEGIGANIGAPMRWARASQAVEGWNYIIVEF